jgi:two-component system response regulator (stage 0 sporulation protein F)
MLAVLSCFVHTLAPTYDIVTVSDAHSALSQLGHRTVVLLITDYLMPIMNGLDLSIAVKERSPTTYVIVVSAYAADSLVHPEHDPQVDRFLTKGDIADQLGAVVRNALPAATADGSMRLEQLVQRQYSAAGAPYGTSSAAVLRWVAERLAPLTQVATTLPRPPTTQTPAIILVEDEPDILIILHRLMRDLTGGYDIITVKSGAEALAAIALRPVPLLITDYNMPGMNGIDLTRDVKAASPDTVVLMITAYPTPDLARRAHDVGVGHYLPKPFSFDLLEEIVRATLG